MALRRRHFQCGTAHSRLLASRGLSNRRLHLGVRSRERESR